MPGTASDETAGALLARLGTDGALWAAEFATKARDVAADRVHEGVAMTTMQAATQMLFDGVGGGWLHGWLCNAIEAGRSAGYSQGLADREAAERLGLAPAAVARLAGYVTHGGGGGSTAVPADLAGSQAADLAGSDLPADLAGSVLERIAEALETLASCVKPPTGYGGMDGPAIRTDPAR